MIAEHSAAATTDNELFATAVGTARIIFIEHDGAGHAFCVKALTMGFVRTDIKGPYEFVLTLTDLIDSYAVWPSMFVAHRKDCECFFTEFAHILKD